MTSEPNDEDVTVEILQQELNSLFKGNEDSMEEWLETRIPVLSGEQPRAMFDTPHRRQRLFQILQEMKFGETA
ncbi:antitoxin Xre/MbcA/ParS toxin-binding domain-containing protein [Neptunicella marina]|uniref:DUF2384 domain-containing protein n=1 Tax=Neptunicella marina TaxID=2125989 RepID=A0A8J6IVS6_9ALTE|nr:antitoxin Xre/MbcA/ParS toxin-binding domain-containing protein [Neptunicella marina]MBC3766710.1 DUF2384 domain-containing protein [Neptunicella marina]